MRAQAACPQTRATGALVDSYVHLRPVALQQGPLGVGARACRSALR